MRRSYGYDSEGGEVIEVTPLNRWVVSGSSVVDEITGATAPSSAYTISGSYFSSTGRNTACSLYFSGVGTSPQLLYMNAYISWNDTTPNQGTNGVSPEGIGHPIRIVSKVYYTAMNMSGTRGFSHLISSTDTTSSRQRGMVLAAYTASSMTTLRYYMVNNYRYYFSNPTASSSSVASSIFTSSDDLVVITFDINTTSRKLRLKVENESGSFSFDTGEQTMLSWNSSYVSSQSQLPIRLGRAVNPYTVANVKSVEIYNGDELDDFTI